MGRYQKQAHIASAILKNGNPTGQKGSYVSTGPLRTPPYHPELQPIETCWAVVKNYVAQNNDCTMKKVFILLEEGFEKVTSKTCQKLIEKVNLQEETFWTEDTSKAI